MLLDEKGLILAIVSQNSTTINFFRKESSNVRMHGFVVVAIAQVFADGPGEGRARHPQQSDRLGARLKAEAPKAWAELADKCAELQWSGTFTTEVEDLDKSGKKRKTFSVVGVQYKQKGNDKYVVIETQAAGGEVGRFPDAQFGQSRAEGWNPSYSFDIRKKNISDRYALKRRQPTPNQGLAVLPTVRLPVGISNAQFRSAGMICGGCIPSTRTLASIFHKPTFRIKSVTDVRDGEKNLVRLDFDFTPWNDRPPLRDAWVLLDPKNHWAVVESGRSFIGDQQREFSFRSRVQYEDGEDGFPIVKRITHSRLATDQSYSATELLEFDQWTYSEAPDENFFLPAYGLAEMDQEAFRESNRLPTYLLALGGLLGVAAAVLRLRRSG